MSERTYGLRLSDDQIIFLVEMLMAGYCSALQSELRAVLCNGHSIMAPLIESIVRENARSLLREPLRDPRFREELIAYFEKHPNENIREFGWKWMQEILVWES